MDQKTDGPMETVYRTAHFEAVPHVGDYAIVHRGDDGAVATGRTFPAEFAALAVEAMETGFAHGAGAMTNAFAGVLAEEFREQKLGELCGPQGIPETITRPVEE